MGSSDQIHTQHCFSSHNMSTELSLSPTDPLSPDVYCATTVHQFTSPLCTWLNGSIFSGFIHWQSASGGLKSRFQLAEKLKRKKEEKKRKGFLRSCPWRTRWGRAACEVVSPSWPTRSTWPAPPGSGRATANAHISLFYSLFLNKAQLNATT